MCYFHIVVGFAILRVSNMVTSQDFDPDPDCAIEEHRWLRVMKPSIALIVDSSKSMEKFRLKLLEDFTSIFGGAYEEFKEPAQYEGGSAYNHIVMALAQVFDGCFTNVHVGKKKWLKELKAENVAEFVAKFNEKIKTHDNSKNGVENALAGVYEAAKYYFWGNSDCKTNLYCSYSYLVLFTGTGFDEQVKNCNGTSMPTMTEIKEVLQETKSRRFRLIGFFPNSQLVEEYAKLTKELDVVYFGYSFNNDESKIMELKDHLLTHIRLDARKYLNVTRTPCMWVDPIGYNTLGL